MPVCSVLYGSLGPRGLEPTRPLCPWNFPSRNAGVGRHFLPPGMEPTSPMSPGLQVDSLPAEPLVKRELHIITITKNQSHIFLFLSQFILPTTHLIKVRGGGEC